MEVLSKSMIENRPLFEQMCKLPEEAGISLKGVFMNAAPGFDIEELRSVCSENETEANIADNARNSDNLLTQVNSTFFLEIDIFKPSTLMYFCLKNLVANLTNEPKNIYFLQS